MTRTHEQHILLNTWAQFGDAHFVTKVKRGWIIENELIRPPTVFKTKREACAFVEAAVLEQARKAQS